MFLYSYKVIYKFAIGCLERRLLFVSMSVCFAHPAPTVRLKSRTCEVSHYADDILIFRDLFD